jgi:hypothetical protein
VHAAIGVDPAGACASHERVDAPSTNIGAYVSK